ncbi:MAG TPA: hypothetical protein ENJ00_12045 [Phycisphaerales bacterium]|nr:hypothetical protein [Phycisphaerales bacterium]
MSSTANLLPAPVKYECHMARRKGMWLTGVSAFGVLCAVGWIVAGIILGGMDEPVRDELEKIRAELNRVEASKAAIATRAKLVSRELGVAEDIAGQPDWSVLLDVLASGLHENSNLEQISVTLVRESGSAGVPPSAVASGPYSVKLAGIAGEQREATQYALYLESSGMFDSVRLNSTSPRPDVGERAVGFEISCTIGRVEEQMP